MSILAVTGGKPDPAGWPLVEDLTSYYQRNFAPRGLCVELPDHPAVLWGDVGALATADAKAFVSLCRIGAGQRRGVEHHEVWLMDSGRGSRPPCTATVACASARRHVGSPSPRR